MEALDLKYVCKKCGKQMLKINESNLLKIAVHMMFSDYIENGIFVIKGVCEECSLSQHIIFCTAVIGV